MTDDAPDVTLYVDWTGQQITSDMAAFEEVSQPFEANGLRVQSGALRRAPWQLGGGPGVDIGDILIVVSSHRDILMTISAGFTILAGFVSTVRGLLALLRNFQQRHGRQPRAVYFALALDGQGEIQPPDFRTEGRYVFIQLPSDPNERMRALDELLLIRLPPIPPTDEAYTGWRLVWDTEVKPDRWSLRLSLRPRR